MKYFSSISLAVLLLVSPISGMQAQAPEPKADDILASALLTAVIGYCAYKGVSALYTYVTTTDQDLINHTNQLCEDMDQRYSWHASIAAHYLGADWKTKTSFSTQSFDALCRDVTYSASYITVFRLKESMCNDLETLQKEKDIISKRLKSCKPELKHEFQKTLNALNERISLVASVLGLTVAVYEIESRKVGIAGRIFTELLV